MTIYAEARQFMKENGNPNQWKDIFPEEQTIINDINSGNHYLCVNDEDQILAQFTFIVGDDPTYHQIDGKWINNAEYGVVHRIASTRREHGAARYCLQWAYDQCHNMRIDTHRDNKPMQNLILSCGFEYCGIILTHDGTPRLAYQKFEGKKLLRSIEKYVPVNQQEEKDRLEMIRVLTSENDLFSRRQPYHFTASAWVTDESHEMVLMAYHNIYDSFSWLGGHCDGDDDCPQVALKEVREESGINNAHLVSEDIISLEILTVEGHVKKGSYVSGHLHYNVTYLIEADIHDHLQVRWEENSAVRWFDKQGAIDSSSEKWFRDNIYSKLNRRL